MQLGAAHALCIVRGFVVHEAVLNERERALHTHLLEPRQAVFVGREARDHVVVAVPVDVVDQHLRAAVLAGEAELVVRPLRIASERLGLAKPAVLPEHILASIAVDVAHTQPVHIGTELVVRGERMDGPARGGVRGIALRPREAPAGHEHELASAIADEVDEVRGLVVHRRRELVALPVQIRALVLSERIAKPEGLLARKADHDDVEPAVRVEIVGPRKEVVRVAFGPEGPGRIELVALAELRPPIPIRSCDHVAGPVAVEVSEARALARELRRELHALERDALRSSGRRDRRFARLGRERAAHEQGQRRCALKTHSRTRPRHRPRRRAPSAPWPSRPRAQDAASTRRAQQHP